MRTRNLLIIMMIFIAVLVSADPSVRLSLATANSFSQEPKFEDVWDIFYNKGKNPFWGIGWEVIKDNLGIGGTYMVDFFRDTADQWNIDYYSEAFYLSFHILGGDFIADPFLQVGLGSAGRILLPEDDYSYHYYSEDEEGSMTNLVIFPFVSTGFALNFDGFVLGSKLNYTPAMSVPPGTDFLEYPMRNFQAILYAGVSLQAPGKHKHNVDWK